MKKLNFYFTGDFKGHYRWSWTTKVDQSFLKKNLVEKFNDVDFVGSHYEDVAKHLGPFYESGKENIKTDIAGIIVPINHGDWSDYFHIAVSIPGDFEKDLEKLWKSNGIIQEHPEDPEILKKRANLTYGFMERTFGIPVFEAWRFLPGYRDVKFPDGNKDMLYVERIKHVENAFNEWLDRKFKTC